MELLILICTFVAVVGVIQYLGWLSQQVQYVVLADGRRQQRQLPLLIRLVLPLTTITPKFLTGAGARKFCIPNDRRIISAGFDGLITGREIILIQVWMAGLGFGLGLLSMRQQGAILTLVWLILVLCMFFYADIWLRGAVARRHKIIQRGLPFMLDLLTLCVEAGLDFMSALSRIIERRKTDALSEEMIQVFHSIKLGQTRRQALREMRDRVNLSDLSVVVNSLVQADELGVSLGAILRIQSDQLRTKRFQRAETLANQAPTKLMVPLVFIFIAALIIMVGPLLLQIFQRV